MPRNESVPRVYRMGPTQTKFTPDAGSVFEKVVCGVCGGSCPKTSAGVKGPRGFASAWGAITASPKEWDPYDVYECPDANETWHLQAQVLLVELNATASLAVRGMIAAEIDQIVRTRTPSLPDLEPERLKTRVRCSTLKRLTKHFQE